jgi:cell wall-associated NlpC family hydrolase
LNSLLAVEAREGRFAKVEGAGWFPDIHLTPIGIFEPDPVAVAERHLGAPYLWGGRESVGLDCSGLVQQALFACGLGCPRDTDQQEGLGRPADLADLRRGDLVFWTGHVALALDGVRVLHANAHHMAVVAEPLSEVVARIAAAGGGPPVACRRLG